MVDNRAARRHSGAREQTRGRRDARARLSQAMPEMMPETMMTIDVNHITDEQLAELEALRPDLAQEIRRQRHSISGGENVDNNPSQDIPQDIAPKRRGRRAVGDQDAVIVDAFTGLYATLGALAYPVNQYDGTVIMTQSQKMAATLVGVAHHHKSVYKALLRVAQGGDYIAFATVHIAVVAALGVNHGLLPRAFFAPFAQTTGLEQPPRTTPKNPGSPHTGSAEVTTSSPIPPMSASNFSSPDMMNPITSTPTDSFQTIGNGWISSWESLKNSPNNTDLPNGSPVTAPMGQPVPLGTPPTEPLPEQNPAISLIDRRE